MNINDRPTAVYRIKDKQTPVCNIVSCERLESGKYRIVFSSGRPYIYNEVTAYNYQSTVEKAIITNKTDLSKERYDEIHIYGKNGEAYVGVKGNGYKKPYWSKDVEISFDAKINPPHVFAYLKKTASIRLKDRGESVPSISTHYERLKGFTHDSLLSCYCMPSLLKKQEKKSDILIFPFGCNGSQSTAVRNAIENRLSVIQGPPGTGKTQTILNIIANLLINGKTCMVASQNNEATKNILEKLEKYQMGFLAASLGSNDNKKEWCLKQNGEWPEQIDSWKLDKNRQETIRKKIRRISEGLEKFFCCQSRLARLKAKEAEFRHQAELNEDRPEGQGKGLHLRRSATALNRILFRHDCEMNCKGKISIFTRLAAAISGMDVTKPETMAAYARKIELKETVREIQRLEEWISDYEKAYRTYQELSMTYLKSVLAERFGGKGHRKIWRHMKSEDNKYLFEFKSDKESSRLFLQDYPIVTSSAFSSAACLHHDSRFDYLIMDEASQVSITEGALAVNFAHSAVIVGDEKQLPNVIDNKERPQATNLFLESRMPAAYDPVRKSFLTSLLSLFPEDVMPRTMLKEHYRCHPKVIGFCNSMFYGGMLEVMTSHEDGESALLEVMTVKGNHATVDNTNEREAQEVLRIVESLENEGITDIGIISPYKNQAEHISSLLAGRYTSATVHKFQGRENDVVIFSTVTNGITDFNDDPNLLNVAVSRAKKRFILVRNGNGLRKGNLQALSEYISYHGTHQEGNIRSIFDILYRQYTEERKSFIQNGTWRSKYLSENRMFELLEKITGTPEGEHLEILFEYPLRELVHTTEGLSEDEKAFAGRSWAHVDFILCDRTTKRPVLAVEVDGYSTHLSEERKLRDGWKDHILETNGIKLMRFSTKGSDEENRLVIRLEEADPFFSKKRKLSQAESSARPHQFRTSP